MKKNYEVRYAIICEHECFFITYGYFLLDGGGAGYWLSAYFSRGLLSCNLLLGWYLQLCKSSGGVSGLFFSIPLLDFGHLCNSLGIEEVG